VGWWGAGFATGAALSAVPWSWGYWPYSNPYCGPPVVVEGTTIDYSQPIVVNLPPAAADAGVPDQAAGAPTAADEAEQLTNAARDAFQQGRYQEALTQVEKAIAKVPNDAALHEFRGLALFALGQYKPAAAAIYAVLSVRSGWDWTTLISLYPGVEVYTEQLRRLEQYCKGNSGAAEARFLLAYHYITCGHTQAAAAMLTNVVRLNPKDRLAAQLLRGLSDAGPAEPSAPAVPAAPARPVEASALVGSWKASRDDGSSVSLDLGDDAQYRWRFQQNDKTQEFSGAYTVADGLLILKQGGSAAMAGQVTPRDGDQFNFKLVGGGPSDPGLTFRK
jgi:tetratricopeptide (TPR) repeat protein